MTWTPLPTPKDLLKGIGGRLAEVFAAMVIIVVMSNTARASFAVIGILLLIFGHWVFGGIFLVVFAIASAIRFF